MRYYAAPLQGITTFLYRSVHHRMFGGAEKYFMPFFSPAREHLITAREMRDLEPGRNAGTPAVPQVMTRNAEDFLWAAGELAAMGYPEINLNLGCPSGTVAAKGKGAGFLARPEELDRFLEKVFSGVSVPVSVKTRLGIRQPEEFARLLEIFNRYPIAELIIHPRVQKDFYKVPARVEAFGLALPRSRNPVCYNGDLATVRDCGAFCLRFPQVNAAMIGRGLIADPALLRKLRGGPGADREELRRFTEKLYRGYRQAYGSSGPAVQRMKELWFYLIRLFADGDGYAKKMRRVSSQGDYETLNSGIFRDLRLLDGTADQWQSGEALRSRG